MRKQIAEMTDERHLKILESSMELFLHYGFRRTTMGDIAGAVGISRPTLYALYPNKEAVFSGVVESYMTQLNARLEKCFEPGESLSEKLHKALEIAVVEPFLKFSGSTFKRELLAIEDEAVQDQIERLARGFEMVYARCFQGHQEKLLQLGSTAEEMGRLFNSACLGIKERATDVGELRKMLGVLVQALAD